MTKIKDFTTLGRKGYDELYADIIKALAPLEKKYGVKFKGSGARHSQAQSDLKITAMILGDNGEVFTREMEEFKTHAHLFGLHASHLFTKFDFMGEQYTIIGLKSGRKNPIQVRATGSGKTYEIAQGAVIKALGLSETQPVGRAALNL